REALKITDRSYLIKDGLVRTHGTPQEIIRDPIAINEYLGHGFSDDSFGAPPPQPRVEPVVERKSQEPGVQSVLEQEWIHRTIERLKGADAHDAMAELIERGPAALPALFQALERRDLEMRRQAYEV